MQRAHAGVKLGVDMKQRVGGKQAVPGSEVDRVGETVGGKQIIAVGVNDTFGGNRSFLMCTISGAGSSEWIGTVGSGGSSKRSKNSSTDGHPSFLPTRSQKAAFGH